MRRTRLYNMYQYLASTIVATRREELIEPLEELALDERDPRKAQILRDALELR
jgi:hypothetical protein